MTGDEEKFTPSFGNMADRRFAKFEGDVQVVIELGMFDRDNY